MGVVGPAVDRQRGRPAGRGVRARARRLRPRRGPRRQGDRRPPRFRPARRRRGRALALRSCGRRGKEHPSPGARRARRGGHAAARGDRRSREAGTLVRGREGPRLREQRAGRGGCGLRRAWRYDVGVEDINKLPLYLTQLTDLPFCVIVPHLFGTTAFAEASWPIATVVWAAERLIPRVYRRAAFHAISDSTRDDLVRRGVPRERIEVIYPGVDATWYSPDAATPRADEPTFLYVGRLKRYKGRSEEHTSELQSRLHLVCRLLLEKKKKS